MDNFMNKPLPLVAGDKIKLNNSNECKNAFKLLDKYGIKARMDLEEPFTIVILESEEK